jgi:hypothetical protein
MFRGAKISEEGMGIRPSSVRLVIWRLAPAVSVIRSESPGNRECAARFRLIRARGAKFVDEAW